MDIMQNINSYVVSFFQILLPNALKAIFSSSLDVNEQMLPQITNEPIVELNNPPISLVLPKKQKLRQKKLPNAPLSYSNFTAFKDFGKDLRSILKHYQPFGSASSHIGIDGSPYANERIYLDLIKHIAMEERHSHIRLGVDFGHGSGITAMHWYCYGCNYYMIGFEFNTHRALYSLRNQLFLINNHQCEVAQMSQFMCNNTINGADSIQYAKILLSSDRHLVSLVHFFCLGWSESDKKTLVVHLNHFTALKHLITDINPDALKDFGFHLPVSKIEKINSKLLPLNAGNRMLYYYQIVPRIVPITYLNPAVHHQLYTKILLSGAQKAHLVTLEMQRLETGAETATVQKKASNLKKRCREV